MGASIKKERNHSEQELGQGFWIIIMVNNSC